MISRTGHPPRKILLTGATGFIGRRFARHCAELGHVVIGLSRSGENVPGLAFSFVWSLGDGMPEGLQADVVLHLAHDGDGEAGAERTISGTIFLAQQLYAAGVGRQLYISSYSAGPHAHSLYGRSKARLEDALGRDSRMIIVRPGLVLGEGGIYARIVKFARRSPVVPLPDGGHGRVPIIAMDRLCRELLALCLEQAPPAQANLFYRHQPSLRSLVKQAAAETGRHPFIIPVPTALALPAMRCTEALGLRPPISSDSLLGFVKNQQAQHLSTIEE